jgi:DNA helicase-4
MRRYNFILEKKSGVLKAYNEFVVLYEGDKYFSKKEYQQWDKKYDYLKSNIMDYKRFIDRIGGVSKSTTIMNSVLEHYLSLFLLPKEYGVVFNYLFNVYENGIQLVISRNKGWVEAELARYQQFFNDQGGSSLTPNQRRAIVVNEANNLAVAGAGTGKTLTLVSKIGYILEKKLAGPDEILVLAFANKAKEELEERVKRVHDAEINVRTFHGYGYEVIGKATGSKPVLSELSFDDALLRKTLQNFLQTRMRDLGFANTLNRYFVYFLNPVENDLDISTQSEYEEYLETIQIRSLRGERVKSLAELELANFFYMNGVDYEYEKKYIVDTSTEAKRQYTPDFYLPAANIWIEHIGIDRSCNTSPGVDRWEYLDSWYWKRKTHRENSTELLETYSYQQLEGTLIEDLSHS